jgi:hypothetical protein
MYYLCHLYQGFCVFFELHLSLFPWAKYPRYWLVRGTSKEDTFENRSFRPGLTGEDDSNSL